MIKICKCDDFCEMNLLFPFHSQRTVDKRGLRFRASSEFEQAFDNTLYNWFQGLVATGPSNSCVQSTTGLPGRGWGCRGIIASVFLGKLSGVSLKRQSWRKPICISPLVLAMLTCQKVTWMAFASFPTEVTAAEHSCPSPSSCPMILPGLYTQYNSMHFLCSLSTCSVLCSGSSSLCIQHLFAQWESLSLAVG